MTALHELLLSWFDAHHRPLPWRDSRDPYRVWVSEVMLQQTTVAAVVPYFTRFLVAFPDIHALAAADEQRVLKMWEGLGYYRRARHLHAAAKVLVASHPHSLPDDPAVWAELPGVGRYILGAVLSQAFDRKLPIVEANSLRVLARVFGYRGDPREGAGKAWVWQAAESVLPDRRAGDFNQALMELGALVCSPTKPRCGACPLAGVCVANRDGLQAAIPPPKKAKEVVAVREVGAVVWDGAKLLLCRRPPDAARWQNMWEVPHAEAAEGEADAEAVVRIVRELTGLLIVAGEEVTTIRHGVTRYAIALTVLSAARAGGRFKRGFYAEAKWVAPTALADYPASAPQRKLMTLLTHPPAQRKLF